MQRQYYWANIFTVVHLVNVKEKLSKGLARHSSIYFSSGILTQIAGFISFPIWARTFSLAEYGILSLATAIEAFVSVFAKFGLQHAILRFYSEFSSGKRSNPISYYYTTITWGGACVGGLVLALFWLSLKLIGDALIQTDFQKILMILCASIYFDVINNIFFTFLRAEERSTKYSALNVFYRYAKLGTCLFFVFVWNMGLVGYFLGRAIVGFVLAIFLTVFFILERKLKLLHFSWSLLKDYINYGLPLSGFELSNVLLVSGDRFLIQLFLGSAAVGLYSAAYNLAIYAVSLFADPLRLAIMPMFMRIWEKSGKENTRQFLTTSFKSYFMFGVPIIFGLTLLGKEGLVLIASEKYASGAVIVPVVISALVFYKAYFIYGAGLYLKKRTLMLMVINLISALLNLGMNFILIPIFGIMGAAVATIVAYGVQIVLLFILSSRMLTFKIPFAALLRYAIISLIMVAILHSLPGSESSNTITKIFLGLLIYPMGLFIIDGETRRRIVNSVKMIFNR